MLAGLKRDQAACCSLMIIWLSSPDQAIHQSRVATQQAAFQSLTTYLLELDLPLA